MTCGTRSSWANRTPSGGAVGYGTADVGHGWSGTLPVLVALPILARAAAGDKVARVEPGATQAQRDDVVSDGGSVSAVPAGPAVASEHLESYGAPVAAGSGVVPRPKVHRAEPPVPVLRRRSVRAVMIALVVAVSVCGGATAPGRQTLMQPSSALAAPGSGTTPTITSSPTTSLPHQFRPSRKPPPVRPPARQALTSLHDDLGRPRALPGLRAPPGPPPSPTPTVARQSRFAAGSS